MKPSLQELNLDSKFRGNPILSAAFLGGLWLNLFSTIRRYMTHIKLGSSGLLQQTVKIINPQMYFEPDYHSDVVA